MFDYNILSILCINYFYLWYHMHHIFCSFLSLSLYDSFIYLLSSFFLLEFLSSSNYIFFFHSLSLLYNKLPSLSHLFFQSFVHFLLFFLVFSRHFSNYFLFLSLIFFHLLIILIQHFVRIIVSDGDHQRFIISFSIFQSDFILEFCHR